jgi:hypothetical protein
MKNPEISTTFFLERKLGKVLLMKTTSVVLAIALTIIVLPVPGGPYNKIPRENTHKKKH